MFSVGPMELIVVLIIALLVVGPKRLPEVGRSVGNGLREFKGALRNAGARDGGEDNGDSELKLQWGDEDDDMFAEERRREEEDRFAALQQEEEAAARRSFSGEA